MRFLLPSFFFSDDKKDLIAADFCLTTQVTFISFFNSVRVILVNLFHYLFLDFFQVIHQETLIVKISNNVSFTSFSRIIF